MTIDRQPPVPKHEVLARYAVASLEPDEHHKMMSSRSTWENRFEEAASLVPWSAVTTWLDVGCGTARFFEKVLARTLPPRLNRCVGIDAIETTLETARSKRWPSHPTVELRQWDIEDLAQLPGGPFDLVTMVGVVYHCGVAPQTAVAQCLAQLAPCGSLLVTTENTRFKGFLADPQGCYPDRREFDEMFQQLNRRPAALTVQYTNPLWRQRCAGVPEGESADYKETFFLASYAGA